MRRLSASVVVCLMLLLLCSCSGFNIDISDSISPPKPLGELYEIQKALEKTAGDDIDLVYPSSGEYRSAIVTNDLNNDGKTEVFAFYSTKTDDKSTVMHINYISWNGEEWVSLSDIQVDSSSVEAVSFVKLDKSATPKILVNWNRYSATDKQLSVYSIDSGVLTEVTKTDYSVYTAFDFNKDGISDIVALYRDFDKNTATATLLSLDEGGFTQKSTCALDNTVISYHEPVVSKFTDGTAAVFVDAEKATGLITEMIYLKDGQLTTGFALNANGENTSTLRASTVRSEDFDGDGCVDIPLALKLPLVEGTSEADGAYMTIWHSFNGQTLKPIAYSVINYTDGYYLKLPENWVGTFAVSRKIDTRQRVFFRWDSETGERGEEILRLQAVSLKDWENSGLAYQHYIELARTTDTVYIAKLSNSAMNPGETYIKDNFHLIDIQKLNDK